MSSESKYFDEGRHLTEAGKEAFKNLLEIISPEEIDALEKEEEKEESEPQRFTNEELEEKMGVFLRIFHKYHINENIREHRCSKFSAWLNTLHRNGCSKDDLINYFNLAFGIISKQISLIEK